MNAVFRSTSVKKMVTVLIGGVMLALAACAGQPAPVQGEVAAAEQEAAAPQENAPAPQGEDASPHPAEEEPAPVEVLGLADSVEDVTGTWLGTWKGGYFLFNEDGTYSWSWYLEDIQANEPRAQGEFWFEGTQFHIKETNALVNTPECTNTSAIYQAQLLSDGDLNFIRVEDSCGRRDENLHGETPLPDPEATGKVVFTRVP